MGEVEEVDDYMSDAFLKNDVDVKPGLVTSRTLKRSLELDAKKSKNDDDNRKRHQPVAKIEMQNRDQGLKAPIEANNKGFALLSKMGFQPGKGLGKTGSGLAEPVAIEIKSDRIGLGHKTVVKEKMAALLEAKQEREISVDEYRIGLREKMVERQIFKDLLNSQRQCRQLDLSHGLSQPDEKWFWPEEKKNTEENEASTEDNDSGHNSDIDLTAGEKLRLVTEYLRDTYFYCVWCGTQFTGDIDMTSNCPGDTFEQH